MLVVIKGAGDIATGIALRLWRSGLQVVMTDLQRPTAIRRTVSFCQAIIDGETVVEDVKAIHAQDTGEALEILKRGCIPVLADEQALCVAMLHPDVVVDAILAKKNMGTTMQDAPLVIAVGPGFTVGTDCHAIVETKRGHYLGRVLLSGSAAPNSGVPGNIGGYTTERIIRAPRAGIFRAVHQIADVVEAGEVVGYVEEEPVRCQIGGVLRGILPDDTPVFEGMKSGDVDPRCEIAHCFCASDKALSVGGGVLEACLRCREKGILEQMKMDFGHCRRISVVGAGGKTSILLQLAQELVAQGKRVAVTTTTHMQHPDYLQKLGVLDLSVFVEEGQKEQCLMAAKQHACIFTGKQEVCSDKEIPRMKAVSEEWLSFLEQHFDILLIEADGARGMMLKSYRSHEPAVAARTDYCVIVMSMLGLGQRIQDVCFAVDEVCAVLDKNRYERLDETDYDKLLWHSGGLLGKLLERGEPQTRYVVALNQCCSDELRQMAKRLSEKWLQRDDPSLLHSTVLWNHTIYEKMKHKTACILLAAGNSVRFCGNKLLSDWKGRPMYQHLADRVAQLPVQKILVTQYPEILEYGRKKGFTVVQNEHPELGISHSMHLGIQAAKEAERFLFAVCDQPQLQLSTLQSMLTLSEITSKGIVGAAVCGKDTETPYELANPNIFHKKYLEQLLQITGDCGGKQIIREAVKSDDVALFFMAGEEAADIDTPQGLESCQRM